MEKYVPYRARHLDYEELSPVSRYIYDNIYKYNTDVRILMTGQVGTGKSFSSLRIAEIFDPDFDVQKQTIYDTKELLETFDYYKNLEQEIAESNLSPSEKKEKIDRLITGKVLIIDEGGVVASNLRFMNEDVEAIKNNLQSLRYLKLILIFNLPVASQFLKSGRQLMNLYCITARRPSFSLRQTYVKVYEYNKDFFTKEQHALKLLKYRNEYGVLTSVNVWVLSKPKRKLWQPYERYSRKRKSQIASLVNTQRSETLLKQQHLNRLLHHLKETKTMSVTNMSKVLEISESSVRKYIKNYTAELQKISEVKRKTMGVY